MTSNPCLEYADVYGRKTDLIHVAKGATYPINILGNAATADVANNPIEDLLPESTDTISFRSGDELDSKANEFTHKISKVEEAVQATNDSEGNNIAETYAKKSEAIALDPETGKVPTEYLPDTTNNVNFVNGQTGTVELTAEDIPYNETKSTKEQMDDIVSDTNSAITALNTNKADKTEIPLVGEELYETTESQSTTETLYSLGNKLYVDSNTEWTETTTTGTLESVTALHTVEIYKDTEENIHYLYKSAGDWFELAGPADYTGTLIDPNLLIIWTRIGEEELNENVYSVSVNRSIFNAYKYEADQVGNEFRLIKKNTTDSTEEIVSSFSINANAIFSFAPQAQVFDLNTNLHVRINMDNDEVYNLAYLEALDKSTGTWTIHNDGNDRIYVMRFGGRFNSGARISPMPHGEFIDSNASITFVLDSDDPYLDRNSFGLLVWRLGEQA